MSAKELAMLEEAFTAEINSALSKAPHVIQPRNKKLADKLVAEGLLAKRTVPLLLRPMGEPFPAEVHGYELTHAGRMLYCSTCTDATQEPKE